MTPETNKKKPLVRFLSFIGDSVLSFVTYVGGIALLVYQILKAIIKERFPWKDTLVQFEVIGVKSTSLTNLIAIFTGMVLALQFIVALSRFGLQLYAGNMIGIALCRELVPVLTALMIAARVGSGITAELASMSVTEQVMAIEAMGCNPIQKLVLPRVIACLFCVPLLSVLADVVGILGGLVITMLETGVGAYFYYDQTVQSLKLSDFVSGTTKTIFFGLFIGLIATYEGLNSQGGTEGVGRSTTTSVVYASICIFISDFILTKVFLLF
ncbi:MAG: ABC transporter permease [Deltaproteobacteria bacterium]|nr:ABC transporter permease [Deltaproteobacteria bacterium]